MKTPRLSNLFRYDLAQQGNKNVGKSQNHRYGQAHAEAVGNGGGDGQGGAHAQQLYQHRILCEKTLFDLLAYIHQVSSPFQSDRLLRQEQR